MEGPGRRPNCLAPENWRAQVPQNLYPCGTLGSGPNQGLRMTSRRAPGSSNHHHSCAGRSASRWRCASFGTFHLPEWKNTRLTGRESSPVWNHEARAMHRGKGRRLNVSPCYSKPAERRTPGLHADPVGTRSFCDYPYSLGETDSFLPFYTACGILPEGRRDSGLARIPVTCSPESAQ